MPPARRRAAPCLFDRLAPTLAEDLAGGAALFLLLWAALLLTGLG
jgi:hypothetical protein